MSSSLLGGVGTNLRIGIDVNPLKQLKLIFYFSSLFSVHHPVPKHLTAEVTQFRQLTERREKMPDFIIDLVWTFDGVRHFLPQELPVPPPQAVHGHFYIGL